MLKKLLGKLLGTKHSGGSYYHPRHSSDDFRKLGRNGNYQQHNHYGNQYYKKKRSSSSYSS